MKKILILAFGAVVLSAVFVRAYRQRKGPENPEKPKAQGYTPSGAGSTVSEPDWGSPFDMNYAQDVARWLAPRRIIGMNPGQAAHFAEQIYLAKGGSWYEDDDEEVVQSIFQKQLRDGIEVATVARKFNWLYKQDLWEYLQSFLSEGELENLVSLPVRSLPPYRLSNS